MSIASSATSLAAGQIAVITATVTDGASAPVSGQAVTFTFSANNSGATLTILSGTTDVSGRAVAQYTAGANSPTISVQDTVLASVPGSAAAVMITRTVGTATGFQIAVTATPTSLAAGATSIIVAHGHECRRHRRAGADGHLRLREQRQRRHPLPAQRRDHRCRRQGLGDLHGGIPLPTLVVQDVVLATRTRHRRGGHHHAPGLVGDGEPDILPHGNSIDAFPQPGGTSIVTATVVGGDNVTPVAGRAGDLLRPDGSWDH